MVKEKGTVLTHKGFGIEDLCLSKGLLLHNRPPFKFDAQYEESDISKNFDVATLRIYNENYIERMRDLLILSACWPKNRCDILDYVYKIFVNIANILYKPIGPKEAASLNKSKDSSSPSADKRHHTSIVIFYLILHLSVFIEPLLR